MINILIKLVIIVLKIIKIKKEKNYIIIDMEKLQ
jgi:hypothetical protein